MSAAQIAPRTGFKFMLLVRDGPDAGASFQLLPPRVTIGRGADNNVTLNDPRMSRNAAVIEFSMEKIVFTDISGRGTMTVNKQFCTEASIKDGDVIRLGDSELTFMVEALPLHPTSRPGMPIMAPLPGQFPPPPQGPGGAMRAPPPSQGLSGRQRFYLVIGAIGLGFAFLLNSKSAPKNPEAGLRTAEQIEKEIEDSLKKMDTIDKVRKFKNEDEKTRFNEAQKHYHEGFRDYQKGQWTRAMRSFETCRAIDPGHQLCGRYYKLSEKQRDEVIALLTLEGRRYKEKGMFQRCSSQFEKVLDMITNKEDVKYKSADQFKKECDQAIEGRFR